MDWEKLSADQLDGVIVNFSALASSAQAVVGEALMEVDRRQAFLADGAPDLVQWVSARLSLRHSTAVQLVGVARRLQDLPLLREKFADGTLSLDQVDALSRLATPDTEAALIGEALGWSTAALDRAAQRAHPPTTADERAVWERRFLMIQNSLDGSEARLHARLPGAAMKIVESAIRERADRIPVNPETDRFDPYPTRLADGLVEVCATSGDENSPSVQVTLHADLEALTTNTETTGVSELEAGPVIANQTARRLACDAIIETAVYDDCRILGVGRKTRTVPGWLRRQLWYRDGGCRFPGCGRQGWVHAHHQKHWADGGPTDLTNLVLFCGFHHRFLHEHDWTIEGDPNHKLTFKKPDGTEYPPVRAGPHPQHRELVPT